jgi:hypothetical protein
VSDTSKPRPQPKPQTPSPKTQDPRPGGRADPGGRGNCRLSTVDCRLGGREDAYAELRAASAFSFLEAASPPEELAERAAELGLPAVALIDRNGLYGAPRFHRAARQAGIKALVGAELTLEEPPHPNLDAGPQDP